MMFKIDLAALEALLQDFSGQLHCLAFDEAQDDPAYEAVREKIRQIAAEHPIVPYLYEGDSRALGHVITEKDLQLFKDYYDLVHERENLIFDRSFCYGVVLGGALKK